jgi:hypothetical protein
MFVTMFCGILDLQTGRVDFSNGHNPAVCRIQRHGDGASQSGGHGLGGGELANLRAGHIVLMQETV